ncbi:PVC-type heme-binding CxxCH protein [Chryseolinea sp. T2]|uniref:PVC-type heme-binding CxxCH protein n=1 Tax=Chryseolinea sp. T2 TaxID=3129255 RepID=UPI0030787628
MKSYCWRAITCLILLAMSMAACTRRDDGPRKIEVLFLGHNSEHHNSATYMPILASALAIEGVNFTYASDPSVLNRANLDQYDALMIYANHDSITSEQEKALLDYVASGKGFLPIHCASFCFKNSPEYIKLVGGQFLKHDTAVFTAEIIQKEHPITQGLSAFESWDETYVHDKLSDDRTVLMERVEGDHREPWTWVKQHGKGRVFYTASGHDERTWSNPGFQQLVLRGISWSVNEDVRKQWEAYRTTMPKLVYRDEADIPNYEKRDPAPRYQEPLSPEESAKLIQVPVGFDLELFASEPDIINPIAMTWDERGRLWVIETVDYPNNVLEDKSTGDDRIKICEDTNGDGKADKFTIFADKLNIPTSIVLANGGAIVSQAPYFLFLKDTNGDDKADVKEVLCEGWGTFDTHAGPSTLQYGFDNKIWGVVGYSGFKGKLAGQDMQFSQGVYRFAPDMSTFEFVSPTTNNTWGLGFTEDNDIFASTANNTHSVFVGIPFKGAQRVNGMPITGSAKLDGHYAMHPITSKVRQVDVFGGFTAASGHSFYTARAYPSGYVGNAFVSEPTGHLVHVANISKSGAGFTESDGWNLFAGADEWVAPVDAKVGPDGAVWVLDWYNFIVQHNPTPTPDRGGYTAQTGKGNAYENPLRDKSHGRVWRVVSKTAKRYDPITLSRENTDGLIEALSNDNLFWRLTAQRLLVERGNADVVPALVKLAGNASDNNYYGSLHALWTIDGLKAASSGEGKDAMTRAVSGNVPAIRKAALQILTRNGWTGNDILSSKLLMDADPGVRLSAINSLQDVSSSADVGKAIYDASVDPIVSKDYWLSQAAYVSAGMHASEFMSAFKSAHPEFDDKKLLHREAAEFNDQQWKSMELPQPIEKAGEDIDGVIWFRRKVDLPSANSKTSLSLGQLDDEGEVWFNGTYIGKSERGNSQKLYDVPPQAVKRGANVVAVKIEDRGWRGGFVGKPEDLFAQQGTKKITLTGPWKYEVERVYGQGNENMFAGTTIAERFAENYLSQSSKQTTETSKDAFVIKLSVIKNQMKYDKTSFEVPAGKPVQIVFENPDFMQHNLVIGAQGSLKIIGKAADAIAADAKGAEMNYVPRISEVLFSTRLVNPQETITLSFIAPSNPGEYPFVCTFPGHWSIMNGLMKVVSNKPL